MILITLLLSFFYITDYNLDDLNEPDFSNFFDYYDINGQLESTEQYHGCTVFISFWSKSCGPCIRSFREDRALREQLMKDGVIIINATIDNKDEWQWALKKYNPNGINVHPKKIQKLQRHFDIYFLPVYATLDLDGNRKKYENDKKGNVKEFAKWFYSRS